MNMTMKLIASLIMAFLISTVFGKFYIPWLHKQKAEQAIKENGPTWHAGKSGTPLWANTSAMHCPSMPPRPRCCHASGDAAV